MHISILTLLLLLPVFSTAIPLDDFYPFGSDTADNSLAPNDDGSSNQIQFSAIFPLFGTDHTTVFVSFHVDSTVVF